MQKLRRLVLLLATLCLPLSGYAALSAACSEALPGSEAVMDDMNGAHAAHAVSKSGRSDNASDASADCPCCDGCLAACASGCGNAISAQGDKRAVYPDDAGYRFLRRDAFRAGPSPPVLIRPPIRFC